MQQRKIRLMQKRKIQSLKAKTAGSETLRFRSSVWKRYQGQSHFFVKCGRRLFPEDETPPEMYGQCQTCRC